MRTLVRARAGLLAAGFGLLAAVSATGCWSTTPNPATRNPNQNIPRQNISTGFQNNNPAGGYAGGAQPSGAPSGPVNNGGLISRTSGAPSDPSARVGMTSGAMAGTPNTLAPLNPPPVNASVQPIATSGDAGAAGRGVQPAGGISRINAMNPTADLDPPPSATPFRQNDAPAVTVPPISAAGLDKPRNWERKSPAMPNDAAAVAPASPPMPKIKTVDPLESLGPPPQ